MKRSRHPSSSDDSDNGSNSTCWSQHSSQPRRGTGQKPSEVFRTDLITAMKVHDSCQLNPEDYYVLADPWRQEWEKGVQVPVSPQSIPEPMARALAEKGKEVMFVRPKKLIRTSGTEALGYVDIRTLAEGMCRYDLSEQDVAWLHIINQEFAEMALPQLDEITMERVMEELERRCYDNMTHAMETEEGLGIEYDEDVVCDVCQSPDGEDNNEMVFCDKCNICVHQACYGIQKVPKGSWLCRICALGILPKCQLCPKKGGAMKPTRSGTKWVHVSCALWIPEVSIGNPEKMEPITNVSHIPSNRWALICCMCKEKTGACIQCSAKNCRTAFHVTCGLHAGLEMNTILTEDDEVKFKSYCPKHSGLEGAECRDSGDEADQAVAAAAAGDKKGKRRGRVRGEDDNANAAAAAACSSSLCRGTAGSEGQQLSSRQQEKRVNQRKLKLQEMEEEFYQFVEVEEVAAQLKLAPETVDFLFQYWKLKRKANFNQPLLTPKKDEEESLARREQEVLLRRLQLFTHLRQDLERVRNLTYMVTRREKMKRSLWRVQEQIFQQQVRLLDQQLLTGNPSTKDLERLFSLDWLTTAASQPHTLKTKRSSLKQDKRGSADRRDGGGGGRTPDARGPRLKEGGASDAAGHEDGETALHHRAEGRKGGRREEAEPEPAARRRETSEHEQEERRRRRRGDGAAAVERGRMASKHLEKTVSVRLVDIRTSDDGGGFAEDTAPQRSPAPLDINTKLRDGGERANGFPRKTNGAHSAAAAAGGHLKAGWGKFRIPKRSEKPVAREREALQLRPLANTPEPSYPRTRLRSTGGEGEDGEAEPCLKRCHSHQLRGDASLSRRYGSDIIRRGVLAS